MAIANCVDHANVGRRRREDGLFSPRRSTGKPVPQLTFSQQENTMALDDFLEPEVGVAVAVTAAVASPKVRKAIRTGLVYGLAGLLMAGDKLKSAASGVAEKARQMATSAGNGAEEGAKSPSVAAEGASS
jgi:hypothetical protein